MSEYTVCKRKHLSGASHHIHVEHFLQREQTKRCERHVVGHRDAAECRNCDVALRLHKHTPQLMNTVDN